MYIRYSVHFKVPVRFSGKVGTTEKHINDILTYSINGLSVYLTTVTKNTIRPILTDSNLNDYITSFRMYINTDDIGLEIEPIDAGTRPYPGIVGADTEIPISNVCYRGEVSTFVLVVYTKSPATSRILKLKGLDRMLAGMFICSAHTRFSISPM